MIAGWFAVIFVTIFMASGAYGWISLAIIPVAIYGLLSGATTNPLPPGHVVELADVTTESLHHVSRHLGLRSSWVPTMSAEQHRWVSAMTSIDEQVPGAVLAVDCHGGKARMGDRTRPMPSPSSQEAMVACSSLRTAIGPAYGLRQSTGTTTPRILLRSSIFTISGLRQLVRSRRPRFGN